MIYVPIHIDKGEELNRQLYKLTQPDGIRDPNNVSEFYCGMYAHPSIPFVALEFPEQDTIPIHLSSNVSGVYNALAIFVDQGQITQQELETIISTLQSNAGQRINPANMIPSSWQQYILTREQAISQGYIPQSD